MWVQLNEKQKYEAWTVSIYLFLIYRNLFISTALIVPLGTEFGMALHVDIM